MGSAGPRVRKLKFKSQDLWISKSLGCNDDNGDCHSLDALLCVRQCAEHVLFNPQSRCEVDAITHTSQRGKLRLGGDKQCSGAAAAE